MKEEAFAREGRGPVSRRAAIGAIGTAVSVAAFAPDVLAQQAPPAPAPNAARTNAPSVISNPPRDFGPNASPVTYPDPDIITIDPAFNALRVNNTAIHRLFTGGQWDEGPAWCAQGTLPRLERHPQRSPTALHRRRRPSHGVPPAVE